MNSYVLFAAGGDAANNDAIAVAADNALMAFKRHIPNKIEVDQTAVSHDSPEVTKRLERIESNFARFDQMMSELEQRLPSDESTSRPKKPK